MFLTKHAFVNGYYILLVLVALVVGGYIATFWRDELLLWLLLQIKWICPTAPTRPVALFGGFPCTACKNSLVYLSSGSKIITIKKSLVRCKPYYLSCNSLMSQPAKFFISGQNHLILFLYSFILCM